MWRQGYLNLATSCLLAALSLAGCWKGFFPCEDEIKAVLSSPDGRWEVTLLQRDCGATTPTTVHVRVHRLKNSPWSSAEKTVAHLRPGPDPLLRWDAGNELVVEGLPGTTFMSRVEEWEGLHVRYIDAAQPPSNGLPKP